MSAYDEMLMGGHALTRPSWDQYWMSLVKVVATRATCDRKHVGAAIILNNRIISTGYNGAARGRPHCDDVGHELVEIDGRPSCIRTLHAESNALDRSGGVEKTEWATIYTTVIPCYDCAKRIVNAGIVRVVYGEYYESRNTKLVLDYFKDAGVSVVCFGDL